MIALPVSVSQSSNAAKCVHLTTNLTLARCVRAFPAKKSSTCTPKKLTHMCQNILRSTFQSKKKKVAKSPIFSKSVQMGLILTQSTACACHKSTACYGVAKRANCTRNRAAIAFRIKSTKTCLQRVIKSGSAKRKLKRSHPPRKKKTITNS